MAASMENMLSTVFQTFTTGDSGSLSLVEMLNVFERNQLISPQKLGSIQDVISHVHTCLGSSKHRAEGLLLLAEIVDQSSTEVFQKHAATWMKLLLQILQSHCPVPVFRASSYILGRIFTFSRNFTDLSRELVSNVIPQLLPLLLNCSAEEKESAVMCFNSCITTYPGPVGPFKTKIQTFLAACDNESQVVHRCYALLTQAGPGGSQGSKHTEAWSQQCDDLLSNLEYILGSMYDGLETELHAQGRPSLMLFAMDVDEPLSVPQLVGGWKKVTGCLATLLSEDIAAVVQVPVSRILQVIYRCVSINGNIVLSRPTTERTMLAAYLQEVHIAALDILQQLIITCRSLLVSYGVTIVGQLSQILAWSQSPLTGHHSQYRYLREKVYDVMVTWIKVCDGCSSVICEEKTIMKQVLEDCKPTTDTLQLGSVLSRNKPEESSSKSKKHKGYQEISQGISTQRKVQLFPNSAMVSKALEALYWIVVTVGSELERQTMQEIQRFTVETLLMIQQRTELPPPYQSATCRRALYRVLQACLLAPHPSAPPPIQCAIGILAQSQRDRNVEVSSFCMEIMRVCESLMHPRVPCLNGPIVCENLVNVGVASGSSAQPLVTSEDQVDTHATNGHTAVDNTSSDMSNDEFPMVVQEPANTNLVQGSRKRTFDDDDNGVGEKIARVELDNGSVKRQEKKVNATAPQPSTSHGQDMFEVNDSEEDDGDDDDVELGAQKVTDNNDTVQGSSATDLEMGSPGELLVATKLSAMNESAPRGNDEGSVEMKADVADDAKDIEEDNSSGEDDKEASQPEEADGAGGRDKMVEAMLSTFVSADPDDD